MSLDEYKQLRTLRGEGVILRFCLQVVVLLVLAGTLFAEPQPLGGSLSMSDPSSIIKCGGRYYVFGSGQGVPSKASSDLLTWSDGPRVFVTAPAWTGMAVHEIGRASCRERV